MVGLPKEIKDAINHLDIQEGMHVIQFGLQRRAHVAHEIAKRVGKEGRVSLVDVLTEDLQAVERQLASQNIHWAHAVEGDFVEINGVPLESNTADRVIIVHTAWRHPSHEQVIQEARRLLKPNGKILFLDWQKETKHPLGKHTHGHLDMLAAQRLCVQSGCQKVERVVNNHDHWGFVMNFQEKGPKE